MFDYILKNATIVDGTGLNPYKGSIVLNKNKIENIIKHDQKHKEKLPSAKKNIDATNLVISPGFIDIHSHNDWLIANPDHLDIMTPIIEQGITTVFTGQCGFSPAPLYKDQFDEITNFNKLLADGEYQLHSDSMNHFFTNLEKNGTAVNMAHMVGHATLKGTLKKVMSHDKLTPSDLNRIHYSIDESFDAGAFGLSIGLGYPPAMYSSREELFWFTRIASKHNGLLAAHLKAYSTLSSAYPFIPGGTPHNIKALNEIFNLVRSIDIPLQISHLIFPTRPAWKTADKVFEIIEKEYTSGVHVSFDAFPYLFGNTTIIAVIPFWFINKFDGSPIKKSLIKRLELEMTIAKIFTGFDLGEVQLLKANTPEYEQYNGQFFNDIAKDKNMKVFDAYFDCAQLSIGRSRVLLPHYYDNEEKDGLLAKTLAHPFCRFQTDCIISSEGSQNPASYGSFPKIIGKFTRDMNLMSLEECIHKMTGASAKKIGLKKRGEIKEGYYADLVIFDYNSINENKKLIGPPQGIEYVFINGKPVYNKGKIDKKKYYGQLIRKNDQ